MQKKIEADWWIEADRQACRQREADRHADKEADWQTETSRHADREREAGVPTKMEADWCLQSETESAD